MELPNTSRSHPTVYIEPMSSSQRAQSDPNKPSQDVLTKVCAAECAERLNNNDNNSSDYNGIIIIIIVIIIMVIMIMMILRIIMIMIIIIIIITTIIIK